MIRFAADRMLGRLARTLRLLGYDTGYSASATPEWLRNWARDEGRTILTRGETAGRFPDVEAIFSVQSENPTQQLREVVARFGLDPRSGLFTRCTLCNGRLGKTDKAEIESLVPARVFAAYDEFFRCAHCRHVYWRGSHVERIVRKLEALFEPPGNITPPEE